MNHIKKITLLILFTFLSLLIVSCGAKNYSLTLGENISANVSNLKKIKEDTNIKLTIQIEEGYKVEYLLLNDQKIYIDTNTYSFTINDNTNVSVYFTEDLDFNYFKLRLPNYVVADVDDINRIYYDTLVTLTIDVPLKRTFKELLINDEKITSLVDNQYSFNIKEDTKVSVDFTFDDGYKQASNLELIGLTTTLNEISLFKEGTLKLSSSMSYNNDLSEGDFLININEDLKFDEVLGSYNLLFNNESVKYDYYYDEDYAYIKTTNEQIKKRRYDADYFFLKIGNMEELLDSFEIEYLNQLEFFNEIFNKTFGLFISAIAFDKDFQDNFVILKKGSQYKIIITFDEDVVKHLLKMAKLDDLDINISPFKGALELAFNRNEVTGLNFLFELDGENKFVLESGLLYTNEVINKPTDLNEYEYIEQSNYEYNIHVDEYVVNIVAKDYIVDLIVDLDLDEEVIDVYLNRFGIEGFYSDSEYNNKLSVSDLKNSPLDIYILFLAEDDND